MYASPHTAGHMQVHQHTIAMPNRHCVCCSASCGPGSCEASAEDADMLDKLGALRWPTRVPWLHRQKRRRAPKPPLQCQTLRKKAEQQSNKRAEMRQSAARRDERYQPKREQNISDRLGLSPSSPCPLPPLPIHGVIGFWWSSACLGFPGPCAPRACSLLPLPFLASEMSICADQVNRGRRKGKRSWK